MRLRSPLAVAAALQQIHSDDSRMSALSFQAFPGPAPVVSSLRFGSAVGDGSMHWLLRRNCSMTPAQLVVFYLTLSAWSLAIAGAFWWRGATLVMPFAGIEILAVGAALLVYARHAGDRATDDVGYRRRHEHHSRPIRERRLANVSAT